MDRVKQGISKFQQIATDSMRQFPMWAFVVIALCAVAYLIVHTKLRRTFVNPENIRNKASEGYSKAAPIILAASKRKSLEEYLKEPTVASTDPTVPLLTNFYFSTVNATGLFFPATDGVFSQDAVRFAIAGGARAFVLDIWPSLDPAANFQPILQCVEAGSQWRRTSMNGLAVETALEAIVSEVYTPSLGTVNTDYKNDVVLLYFRFHGGPRNATYDSLAATCRRVLNPYKLDAAFSSCRGMETLVKTSLQDLKGRVIVLSNKTKKELEEEYTEEAAAAGSSQTTNPLIPYINFCPRDSIPIEIDFAAVDEAALRAKRGYIQNSLVFVVPPVESEEAATNNWGEKLRICRDAGIHCMALNVFDAEASQGYAEFLFKDYFSTFSYRLKEPSLRLQGVLQAPAQSAGDTGVAVPLATPGITTGPSAT